MDNFLDELWSALLSRNAKHVLAAYARLTAEEQQSVQEHLLRMIKEPGWQPEQRISAQTALNILLNNTKQV